ncbi:hypothetical protein, partial [Nocardia brasiliensis]|uniref:hypothetical protein n=1 Tax=Nocardia brasiliensis TaxID=37326 RepID=UPI002458AD85
MHPGTPIHLTKFEKAGPWGGGGGGGGPGGGGGAGGEDVLWLGGGGGGGGVREREGGWVGVRVKNEGGG